MLVLSNLATSLDGKIAMSNRAHFPLGTLEDRSQMQRLRRCADAVLFGAATLRAFRRPCIVAKIRASDPPLPLKQPMNVVVSSKLEGISPGWPFFRARGFERVLFVSQEASLRRLRLFERSCQIIVLSKPTSKIPAALQMIRSLEKLGVQRLLVEGGGAIMWDFASQDLIDEYHLTLTPRIVGGENSPTLVEGPGLTADRLVNLKLEQCRIVGDELYLVYRKTGKRGTEVARAMSSR